LGTERLGYVDVWNLVDGDGTGVVEVRELSARGINLADLYDDVEVIMVGT
jgi:hypothetical protein